MTPVITYDAGPQGAPDEGDVLVSMRGRARYLVVAARRVRSAVHPNRWRLVVDRHDEIEPTWEPGGGTWPLYWHPRGRRA